MRYVVNGTAAAFLGLAIVGCSGRPAETKAPTAPPVAVSSPAVAPKEDPEEVEIREALAKLSPEDRALAEKQRLCVIEEDSRLGSMGTPIKLDVKGRTVFVCCKGCRNDALADPNKTLARLDKLTAAAK
jgi:hypothetical protein